MEPLGLLLRERLTCLLGDVEYRLRRARERAKARAKPSHDPVLTTPAAVEARLRAATADQRDMERYQGWCQALREVLAVPQREAEAA